MNENFLLRRWAQNAVYRIGFPGDRKKVYQELMNHMEDHRDALMEQGKSEKEACEAVEKAMGDPFAVAKDLAEIHRPFWGYFLMATGDRQYADRMEKIFFNAFPGSLLKDFSALQYLSSPNQVIATSGSNNSFFFRGTAALRQFRSDHSAQCCTGNVHRILPNYLMRMWMLNEDQAPSAVLYGPSEHTGTFNGIDYKISEVTEYPCESTITFRFAVSSALDMPFTFRIPQWCNSAVVKINGKECVMPEIRKGFATIRRIWNDGDTLTLELPMTPVQKKDR